MTGYRLSEGAVKKTAKVVDRVLGRTPGTPRGRSTLRLAPDTRYLGKLTTTLEAPVIDPEADPPEEVLGVYTTAMVKVWVPDPDDDGTADYPKFVESDIDEIEVVNRDPSLEGGVGAVVKIEFIFGEWQFYWVGC